MARPEGHRGRLWPALALGGGLLLVGCAGEGAVPAPPVAEPTTGPPPRPVRVAEVVAASEAGGFQTTLYVERDVWLSARATGIIEKVLVDRGSRVRAGDPLVVLETDLRDGELRIAEESLRLAQAEYERTSSLFSEKVVSPIEALRAEIARDLARSEVELARARLERCTLRAPFDGVVVERTAVPGERVIEEDSTPLVRLVGADRPRARANLPEESFARVATGAEATVETLSGDRIPARVVFVSPAVDAASGTGAVIVEVVGSTGGLRPGSAVRIHFAGSDSAGPVQSLPREAIPAGSEPGGRITVLVATGGRAERREVELVALGGLDARVRGLSAGELVVLDRGVRDGDRVEVRGAR